MSPNSPVLFVSLCPVCSFRLSVTFVACPVHLSPVRSVRRLSGTFVACPVCSSPVRSVRRLSGLFVACQVCSCLLSVKLQHYFRHGWRSEIRENKRLSWERHHHHPFGSRQQQKNNNKFLFFWPKNEFSRVSQTFYRFNFVEPNKRFVLWSYVAQTERERERNKGRKITFVDIIVHTLVLIIHPSIPPSIHPSCQHDFTMGIILKDRNLLFDHPLHIKWIIETKGNKRIPKTIFCPRKKRSTCFLYRFDIPSPHTSIGEKAHQKNSAKPINNNIYYYLF